jgi:dimethylargininase
MEQNLGRPDFMKAQEQHAAYVSALEKCGLEVLVLDADEDHPDSTFVEDVAVITKECAIMSNPLPPSRKGETRRMSKVLKGFRGEMHTITAPGNLEGGDVLQIDRDFYVGISGRTNEAGAQQLKDILSRHGYNVTFVPVRKVFHLKCAVSYLGDQCIAIAGELVGHEAFQHYKQLVVGDDELYACNSLRVNDFVLTPKGFNRTKDKLLEAGFSLMELDVSEFRKQDGGLTCLSLRF